MRLTPHEARLYLLIAAFYIALPSLATLYKGHTGRMLVASAVKSIVPEGPFYHSVVYLTYHDLFKAHGYVINIPRKEIENAVQGGPLSPDDVVFMGRDAEGNIRFSSVEDNPALSDIRAVYGYAGWGPIQLNLEIVKGGWDAIDYDPVLVFETPLEDIWPKARRRVLEGKPVDDKNVL